MLIICVFLLAGAVYGTFEAVRYKVWIYELYHVRIGNVSYSLFKQTAKWHKCLTLLETCLSVHILVGVCNFQRTCLFAVHNLVTV